MDRWTRHGRTAAVLRLPARSVTRTVVRYVPTNKRQDGAQDTLTVRVLNERDLDVSSLVVFRTRKVPRKIRSRSLIEKLNRWVPVPVEGSGETPDHTIRGATVSMTTSVLAVE